VSIITSEELKTFLGIADTVDEPTIISATAAANEWVEAYCGRTFAAPAAATAKTFRPTDQRTLSVPDFSTAAGLIVKTDDDDDGTYETTWTVTTDFIVEGVDGRPYDQLVAVGSRLFPVWNRHRSVQVTAVWGWTAVPGAVQHATRIQAARLFKRKDSPAGVLGGFADFTALRVSSRIDPDVADMLQPFRHPDIAVHVA